ncbi:MAG: hypothetical protein RIB64_13970, partial [Arenibacter algicola]
MKHFITKGIEHFNRTVFLWNSGVQASNLVGSCSLLWAKWVQGLMFKVSHVQSLYRRLSGVEIGVSCEFKVQDYYLVGSCSLQWADW